MGSAPAAPPSLEMKTSTIIFQTEATLCIIKSFQLEKTYQAHVAMQLIRAADAEQEQNSFSASVF